MVEKIGHKKFLTKYRLDWISEGKSKQSGGDGDREVPDRDDRDPNALEPTSNDDKLETEISWTPMEDDIFNDEHIYDATPRAPRALTGAVDNTNSHPDLEDDLDALIAEAEVDAHERSKVSHAGRSRSPGRNADDFADDEAAMAEMDNL
jgi:replication fork protection complex subunit Csm3/Swi3